MNEDHRNHLLASRFTRPQAIAVAAKNRRLHATTTDEERFLIVAADHAARGALDVGTNASAMSNRYDMLDRLVTALAIPGVNGVLGNMPEFREAFACHEGQPMVRAPACRVW